MLMSFDSVRQLHDRYITQWKVEVVHTNLIFFLCLFEIPLALGVQVMMQFYQFSFDIVEWPRQFT